MPKFMADFHIHSRYSRATSKDMTVPDAQEHFTELVDELKKGGEPIAITEEGKAAVVMLSISDYQDLIGAIRFLQHELDYEM